MMSQNTFLQIRNLVKTIPRGKVATYGQIASALTINDSRIVGWALRNNADPSIPCHRVVKKGGILSLNFSLGNWPEQKRRLSQEGLKFSGNRIINFPKHLVSSKDLLRHLSF